MAKTRKIGLKDYQGREILIGDTLQAKWGGVGKVIFEDGKLLIAFEDGNYKIELDKENIDYRELIKVYGGQARHSSQA